MDADEVDAVVVSEAVDVASVVVAVRAATIPVLKMPKMMRLITRTLAAENVIGWVLMLLNLTNKTTVYRSAESILALIHGTSFLL